MKKRKRWLIVAIFVIVVAAVAAGAYLWFGRSTTAMVHYLTAKVTTGTISQTVSADFTLDSATGTTSVALGGGAANGSSSSSSSATPGTTATSSLQTSGLDSGPALASSHTTGGEAVTPAFAVYVASTSATTRQVSDALPIVTAVSPSCASTAGGTSVSVTGSGFSTSAPTVEFGANAATGVSVSSDTSLTCASPAGSAGTVDVTVTTTAGSSATSSSSSSWTPS